MSLCHREIKINYANVQQFLCAIARLNVYHVCMLGAALSRLAAVRCYALGLIVNSILRLLK